MAGDVKTKILRDAEKLVVQGKVSQAIAEYLKIIKNDPNDVLTLNTVGDLYLRLGRTDEANNYFSQVADNYRRNNFLLKAIAVYKKILIADPENLEINQTLASLFAQHGLNADARNQYLKVAEISSREGKARESLEAYEKVAEFDPMNAAIQLKLADIQIADGATEKAHSYLANAARAQVKGGNLAGAITSYRRAMKLNPSDMSVMKSLFEACIQHGDVSPALDHLKDSLALAPDNIDLIEMSGRASLATGDLKGALSSFEAVVSRDDRRFGLFFEVHKSHLAAGDLDDASTSLDYILPILVRHRGADRGVEAYGAILAVNPSHIPTWKRLATLYSNINDVEHYLDAQDKLADLYLKQQNPRQAIEHLDLFLQIEPNSEKHLKLHREAFSAAYPGEPYALPAKDGASASDLPHVALSPDVAFDDLTKKGTSATAPTLVEADLLLNYGLHDKALDLLHAMAQRDPADREVRKKLIAVYEEQQKPTLAAEQCLLLATLHRKAGEEETVARLLAEAKRLDAALVVARMDELLPPLKAESLPSLPSKTEPVPPPPPMEVDLSGDLSEIFFQGSGKSGAHAETEPRDSSPPQEIVDEYIPAVVPKTPEGTLNDQLQEVDFYIRLGFHEEARTKLQEISKDRPNDPDIARRFTQIAGSVQPQTSPSGGRGSGDLEQAEFDQEHMTSRFGELITDEVPGTPRGDHSGATAAESAGSAEEMARPKETSPLTQNQAAPQPSREGLISEAEQVAPEGQVNDMFADLLEEVNAITDQEIAREDFETHFSLGTAYREMGLIDEAIREFQGASKALDASKYPREVIRCYGMLSTCFLEKAMPKSAIRWCESGLGVPGISQHEAAALRYDMGVAFSNAGEADRALECFESIFSVDPGYRDIAQKIDELRGRSGRNAT